MGLVLDALRSLWVRPKCARCQGTPVEETWMYCAPCTAASAASREATRERARRRRRTQNALHRAALKREARALAKQNTLLASPTPKPGPVTVQKGEPYQP